MGIKDLAKLGFERDNERDKRATQLVARPATPHPPVRQPATGAATGAAAGAAAWVTADITSCRDAPDTAGAYQRPPQPSWRAADWRAYYDERATLRKHSGKRPRPDAERLAWGELQNEWHRLHGEHTPAWQCAGCQKPIGGQPVFAFPDGARAHDDLGCIAAYRKRWRSSATTALVEKGLPRPAVVPEDDS